MRTWTHKPFKDSGQERYSFSGTCYLTPRAREKLTDEDLDAIIVDLLEYIYVYETVEKCQRYVSGSGRTVYLEDCEDLASRRLLPPHRNYFIISISGDRCLVKKSRLSPRPCLIEYEVKERPCEEWYTQKTQTNGNLDATTAAAKGNYFFDGGFKILPTVYAELDEDELLQIDLRQHVLQNNGVYDKQVYRSDDGRELWVIDNLSRDQLQHHPRSEHYYEILFPKEVLNEDLCRY